MTIEIRILEPSDCDIARTIISEGLFTAVTHGFRTSKVCWIFISSIGLAMFGTFRYFWPYHKLLGSALASSAIVWFMWFWPRNVIQSYIDEALQTDLRDPMSHYVNADGGKSCFWVAVEKGVVVGTVAVEPKQGKKDAAELRRMSVAASHRRRGVSKLLYRELHKFAVDKGFERIVLSTSSLQQAAVKIYDKFGFTCYKKDFVPFPWLPLVHIHFFAIPTNTTMKTKEH